MPLAAHRQLAARQGGARGKAYIYVWDLSHAQNRVEQAVSGWPTPAPGVDGTVQDVG